MERQGVGLVMWEKIVSKFFSAIDVIWALLREFKIYTLNKISSANIKVKKALPIFRVWSFLVVEFLSILKRFLFCSIYGFLVMAVAFYLFSYFSFEVKPLNLEGLFVWMSELGERAKISIMTSLLTIIGFLIAFSAVTANRKAQFLSDLKMAAHEDVDNFTSEYTAAINICTSYLIGFNRVRDRIDLGAHAEEVVQLIGLCTGEVEAFTKARNSLISMSVNVHSLTAKHAVVLLSTRGLQAKLDIGINELKKLPRALELPLPYFSEGDTIQTFVDLFDGVDIKATELELAEISKVFNFSVGSVKGSLLKHGVPLNLWALLYLYKERKELINKY